MIFTVQAAFQVTVRTTVQDQHGELSRYADRLREALMHGGDECGLVSTPVEKSGHVLEIELRFDVADATRARRAGVHRLHAALSQAGAPPEVEAVQLTLDVRGQPDLPVQCDEPAA